MRWLTALGLLSLAVVPSLPAEAGEARPLRSGRVYGARFSIFDSPFSIFTFPFSSSIVNSTPLFSFSYARPVRMTPRRQFVLVL